MLLRHPAFPAIQEDVPDESADEWLAMGWRPVVAPGPIPNDPTPSVGVQDTAPASMVPSVTADTIGVDASVTGDDQAASATPEAPAGAQE